MAHWDKPEAKSQVLDAISSVLAVNPELVAHVIVFVPMIDGSVVTLHTVCCLTHASVLCESGLNQAAGELGWGCPHGG